MPKKEEKIEESEKIKNKIKKVEKQNKDKKIQKATKTKKTTKKLEEKETKNDRLVGVIDKIEEVAREQRKEEKSLKVKKNPKEISIKPEKLEKIEEEIKKQTTVSEEKVRKINSKIFINIAIAIVIVIYFLLLNVGYSSIQPNIYLTDLQVFSIILIAITIIIFERAYKKDSGEYTIYGIESMFLSITTLLLINIYKLYNHKYIYIITAISSIFAIYYVGKSIIIYIKMKRKAMKQVSDIHKIIKK